jgi:hypothetical protein
MDKKEDGQEKFLSLSTAYMWIISASVVISISLAALVRIKFNIDRVGLSVIIFYNILFLLYFSSSIVTLVDDGDSAKIP